MKVILLKDIKKIGIIGDEVEVKDGYARNYLIPQDIAIKSNKGALRVVEQKKREKAKKEVELGRVTNIDPDNIFEILLEEIHPDADGKKRLELLQEYAEAGIQILKDRYDNEKKIDLEEIIEEMRS